MTPEQHYKKAEELLKKSHEPALQVNQKTHILMQAQVHATLATRT